MSQPIRVFLSTDDADETLAYDLEKHLRQAFAPQPLLFWHERPVAEEDYRRLATAFLETAHLFLPIVSVNYLDTPDARWELDQAVSEALRRPGLAVLTVLARSAFIPPVLQGYPIAPGPQQPVDMKGLDRERQVQRVAEAARVLVSQMPATAQNRRVDIQLPIMVEDLRERLIPLLDRLEFTPLFDTLKMLAHDATLAKNIFETEDSFANLYQQTRGLKTSLPEFLRQIKTVREYLRTLLDELREGDLAPDWQKKFIADFFAFQPVNHQGVAPYFFTPTEEISLPDTLTLPGSPDDIAAAETIGLLSYQQKLDFRRNLLLAQDSMALEQYGRAYSHSEHVRTHIDPQSAQLYEYLLISYLHREKPERIVEDALFNTGRLMSHITLFAGKLRRYQEENKCPTATGAYNRRVAAEILSDGMKIVYDTWPNDHVLDTGRRAALAAPNREAARKFIEAAQLVYRAIHPMRGGLRILVNELCGGGKFNWVSRLGFADGEIRFFSEESFDLESQIAELLELIADVDKGDLEKQRQQTDIIRENLYFSLLAKRQLLARQVAEERRKRRSFTDLHQSVIHYVYACLLGHRVFGDGMSGGKEQSYLRLAVEYLLPGLVISPDADAESLQVRWFDLDANGELIAHPDCTRYQFDARAVLEKIVYDYAGRAGWLQVQPNLKAEVFQQYVHDTEVEYQEIKTGLSWSDFRKIHSFEARKRLVRCLQRWETCYRAYPETGVQFLDRIINELVGEGLMNWFFLDPFEVRTVPDSLAFGYDAFEKLRRLRQLPIRRSESDISKALAHHLFQTNVLPVYNRIKTGDEKQRPELIGLLWQALALYKNLDPRQEYLDFVWNELTEERKLAWLDVSEQGEWTLKPFQSLEPAFNPIQILQQLKRENPGRYDGMEARARIADRRFRDLETLYFREISEYKYQNHLEERRIAVEILRKIKGLFKFFPRPEYLDLPIRELSGHGRIRWQAQLFGVFAIPENYYENQYFNFDYRRELSEFKGYRDTAFQWMEHVLGQEK
ncbi:MAG: hypothetical protein IT259_11660 [Saprospiraceae bacterium]|nr:hypothetical protein [Saprospiraceae bacterium]